MRVQVVREVPHSIADVFLRDEDGETIAIFTRMHRGIADSVAAFLNRPPDEELIALLRAEHMTRLDQQLTYSVVPPHAAEIREHLLAVKDSRYEVWRSCAVCAVLVGADG